MNKKALSIIMILIVGTISLLSCSNDGQTTYNMTLSDGTQIDNWNTSIRLIDDPMLLNSHQNGEILTLQAKNLSDAVIVFPNDFGVKILSWDGQAWIEIANNFYYSGEKILPTNDAYPLGLLVSTLPYIPNLSSPKELRIHIIGHSESNEKELLGAYIDITINP